MTRRCSLVGAVLASLLLAGCIGLPEDGPVVESDVVEEQDARRASDIDARPPSKGASRTEVVTGFLEAMTSWPIQTNVAKEYLTDEAADQWNPERETIVYTDSLPARELGGAVTVRLTTADRLDRIGAWRGALPDADLTLRYRVRVEQGEYRIADPQDARVVPASWFQQRYRQVSLYYFDPIAQILVPEPVFVPEGEQLATTLVSALISGPPPRLRRTARTFIPSGLSVGLSVPIDDDGVAAVTLVGDAPQVSPEEAELLLAQLAWTLRQDSTIRALRVSIGGADLGVPGGGSTYPVDAPQKFDPAGADATGELFGISQGRLVSGEPGALTPVAGPFGDEDVDLVSVATTVDGRRAAGVDLAGQRVRVGPVDEPADTEPQTLLTTAAAFARPTWDHGGRLWVLERRAAGAVVWVVDGGPPRQVRVPGVTGQRARHLVVSRDGTRLVGVVRRAGGDEVVGARVQINGRGRVAGVRSPFVLRRGASSRISDLAWTSPIRLALLTPTQPGGLYEVDIVPADGSSIGVDTLSTIVPGRVLGLAGSPAPGVPPLAVFADRYTSILTQEQHSVADPMVLADLDYAG